jgi:hypothetical protein
MLAMVYSFRPGRLHAYRFLRTQRIMEFDLFLSRIPRRVLWPLCGPRKNACGRGFIGSILSPIIPQVHIPMHKTSSLDRRFSDPIVSETTHSSSPGIPRPQREVQTGTHNRGISKTLFSSRWAAYTCAAGITCCQKAPCQLGNPEDPTQRHPSTTLRGRVGRVRHRVPGDHGSLTRHTSFG